ncbi:hypothetical protein [Sphingobium xenophagum]
MLNSSCRATTRGTRNRSKLQEREKWEKLAGAKGVARYGRGAKAMFLHGIEPLEARCRGLGNLAKKARDDGLTVPRRQSKRFVSNGEAGEGSGRYLHRMK